MARGSLKRRGLSFVRFGLAFATIVELASVAALGASAGARSFSVDTGEPPTSVTSSADGTLLFVGLARHFSDPGGIAAYRRVGAETIALGSIELAEGAQGLALTPDESSLLFTMRTGPGIVAVATLLRTG
ncbi:MAG: hypothetical protein IAI50_21995, partial [Candidatus Eremiobacteraeota bacterium]|nr:hypothetical protein [Candidatus Eremiobacteraeota bacterium]